MTYDELITLINAFRAETQQNAITPDSLGQLLKKMVDYVKERDIDTSVEHALEQIEEAYNTAMDGIGDAVTNGEEDIATAKDEAISAVESLVEEFDLKYVVLN